jgi:predicted DNA-binding antitoxin AbrB/MazE fold protein
MAQPELVRAIYREGALQLAEPLDLPEGVEVWVKVRLKPQPKTEAVSRPRAIHPGPRYPTRSQSPETLARLIGLFAVGGDALKD